MEEFNMYDRENYNQSWRNVSWWFIAIMILFLLFVYLIIAEPELYNAFRFIRNGVLVTCFITIGAFFLALAFGIPVGLVCKSRNPVLQNLALFYMALIGGVPTLVMVFLVAFVIAPYASSIFGFEREQFPMAIRGILALALAYSVILADIIRLSPIVDSEENDISSVIHQFRQSIKRASFPATREKTIMALGLMFIALLKDSSLVSVLAVLEITQQFKIYIGSTVRFQEAIFSAVFLYLIMTVPLRYLLWRYEYKPEMPEINFESPELA